MLFSIVVISDGMVGLVINLIFCISYFWNQFPSEVYVVCLFVCFSDSILLACEHILPRKDWLLFMEIIENGTIHIYF